MESNSTIKRLGFLLDQLKEPSLEENLTAKGDLINKFWGYYKSQGRQSYHDVTKYVLENIKESKDAEGIAVIAENLKSLMKVLQQECQCTDTITYFDCKKYTDPFQCDNTHDVDGGVYNCYDYKLLYKFLFKLYDHIQLEFISWSKIRSETDKISSLNANLRKQLENAEEQQARITSKLHKVEEETKSIYMQIISILGIFAAIVIAVFGSLNVINSIATAFLQGDISAWRSVLVSSMCALFVIWVIFVLLGMVRWFRFKAEPTKFSVVSFLGINVACIVGIIVSLIHICS